MDIVLLDYLLRLFALIANLYPSLLYENVKDFLKSFLLKELNAEIVNDSITLFNEYYQKYSDIRKSPNSPENYRTLMETIQQIDHDIPAKQKFHILLRLLFFEKFLLQYTFIASQNQVSFSDILKKVIQNFRISETEFLNCRGFISDSLYTIPEKNKVLIVAAKKNFDLDIHFLKRNHLTGQIFFLYVESVNAILFFYKGSGSMTFNNQAVFVNHTYILNQGSAIKGQGFEPVYYNQIIRRFRSNDVTNLVLAANDIEYHFKNSSNGIKKLNIWLESGQLIGVVGRSGVGKSTLVNILIGKSKPQKGTVTINGLDLHRDSEKLEGLIGYISQDDLLIEELTVFTNLYLNAELCFGNLPAQALHDKVNNLLIEFDLYEVRNLKVGTPLERYISGGQRKKLNIALELIREPWILFADEPTSGLSSSDSEEIMQLLAEQAIKGCIVAVNIHQPSSDIFKLFDKIIVLDKEGHLTYFGNPLEAIPHFNDYTQRISTAADSCVVCENVNPEAIFKILEEKKANELGELTKERKTSPAEWHEYYLSKAAKTESSNPIAEGVLPEIQFNKPSPIRQFLIFSKRNLMSKYANMQYVLLALLISPLLALVLASLCRYKDINEETVSRYTFAANDNIPSFLFMSVIVALFIGLIISAEEIIRDRKILLREKYLKLNIYAYLHSKVAFIFVLSAFQTITYIVISNAILDIEGMTIYFWMVLFSIAFFANLMGLLISSLFNSVIAIYIMVPLIIVPQMLLSGVVVNYDKLNNLVSSKEYVPVVGDFMASRWAYEAMVVTQFAENEYQQNFYDIEKAESSVKFNLLFVVPEIQRHISELRSPSFNNTSQKYKNDVLFLHNEFFTLKENGFGEYLADVPFDAPNFQKLEKAINHFNITLSEKLGLLSRQKDSITQAMVTKLGSTDLFLDYKSRFFNESLADLVLKRKELESYVRIDNKIIRRLEPVYQEPVSKFGRAQFLSSSKTIGSTHFSTLYFNLIAIWMMSLILYGVLIFFPRFIRQTS